VQPWILAAELAPKSFHARCSYKFARIRQYITTAPISGIGTTRSTSQTASPAMIAATII
jgi:hypothetical protein